LNLNVLLRDNTGVIPRRGDTAGIGPADDTALVRRVAAGDEQAFARLYHGHGAPLYNYIVRLVHDPAVAENLLQDVFVAVWQGAGRFRGSAQVRTWLFRIAHNQAVSWLRRERAGQGPEDSHDVGGVADAAGEPEAAAMSAWHADQVRRALDLLKPDHRAVIELVFFHELTYAEVAEVLDCPVGTVKSRMSWARRNLAEALKKLEHVS